MWITPTADDVLSEFTPAEVATINNLMGGGVVVTNRLGLILGRTVAEIRDYIASGRYDLDPAPSTLPPSMLEDAIAITRWRFLVSVPQLKQLQTEERRDAMLRSIVKLKEVADQKFVPESPVDTTVNTAGMWNSENKLIMRTHPVTPPSTQFQTQPTQPPYANPIAPKDSP